ncbi:ATP-binding response regulator [Stenotrophobium rhamnosiphilum]|uniref:ATP-binding response regulator n=1 Tax=Stenotrophobium rhamnosiphilum TaxID=2029166 RepID=UPI001375142C|nr:hybrid sensor histidine kinase/response regulator [Stenotrophobium rhamnosiphilum]
MSVSVCVSAVAVAALVMPYVQITLPLAWLVLVVLTTVLHSRVLSGLLKPDHRSEDSKLTIAAISFGLRGLLLASLIYVFPFVPVTIGAVLTIYNVGICSATVSATAGFRRIFAPYAIVTLGPIALVWSISANLQVAFYERMLFVGLAIVYLISMLGHAKGTFAAFLDSYNNRVQVIELNKQLTVALQDAETANHAKTQFLASASHDLRQPIHALSLFSGSLLMRNLDERSAVIARQIDKSITALTSQLDGLLDISRLDAGVVAKSISVVQLHDSLQQLVQEFLPQAKSKSLRMTLHCSVDAYVRTDPMLLQRILRNLISNAIKYTDRGSVEIVVIQQNQSWRVRVKDSGIGIPAAEHKRIFEEFYQFDNPERDGSRGLGLGLAIVRRLAKLLELGVEIESQPGSGSQFSLDIPRANKEESVMALPAMESQVKSTNVQVLVIDDAPIIRQVMQTVLEELGFGVVTCESTVTAVELCRTYKPSIVLADFRLRGTDNGLQAIQSVRTIWPDLPAFLISGDTEPARLREAHDAGIELLHKPLASADLLRHIMKAVEQ